MSPIGPRLAGERLRVALELAVRVDTARLVREALARSLLVGPYDDAGVAAPGTEKGPGFAIFIGEWRIGWWPTRADACEVAYLLEHAITDHPLSLPCMSETGTTDTKGVSR